MNDQDKTRPTSAGINELFDNSKDSPSKEERSFEKKHNGKAAKYNKHPKHQDSEKRKKQTPPPAEDSEAVSEGKCPAELETVDEVIVTTDTPAVYEVIGIRFKNKGKIYYFDPEGVKFSKGDSAIVETARGIEYGFVALENIDVPASEIVPPLRQVIRLATPEDDEKYESNLVKEKEAFNICLEKIHNHQLEMKLIDAEYTFDQSKLTFYFSAEGRIDFRELVKDLASVFRTRIELRQIGIRDEAKLIGGLGVCGRPFCCTTFLSDFAQVSIKMAKEQSLSLNSAKISGACGRLMCCLRFEHEAYEEEISRTPAVGKTVKTPEGVGTVVESFPLRGKVKVKIGEDNNVKITEFHRDEVTLFPKSKS